MTVRHRMSVRAGLFQRQVLEDCEKDATSSAVEVSQLGGLKPISRIPNSSGRDHFDGSVMFFSARRL